MCERAERASEPKLGGRTLLLFHSHKQNSLALVAVAVVVVVDGRRRYLFRLTRSSRLWSFGKANAEPAPRALVHGTHTHSHTRTHTHAEALTQTHMQTHTQHYSLFAIIVDFVVVSSGAKLVHEFFCHQQTHRQSRPVGSLRGLTLANTHAHAQSRSILWLSLSLSLVSVRERASQCQGLTESVSVVWSRLPSEYYTIAITQHRHEKGEQDDDGDDKKLLQSCRCGRQQAHKITFTTASNLTDSSLARPRLPQDSAVFAGAICSRGPSPLSPSAGPASAKTHTRPSPPSS